MPPTYAYPAVPATRFLDDAVRDFPDVVAVDDGASRLTYAEVGAATGRLAAALAAQGIAAGSRVAVSAGNSIATPVVVFALLRVGATLAPPDAADLDLAIVDDPATGPRATHTLRAEHGLGRTWQTRVRSRLRAGLRRPPSAPGRGPSLADLLGAHGATGLVADAPLAPPDGPAAMEVGSPDPLALTTANLVAAAFQTRLWVPDEQAGRERLLVALPLTGPVGLTAGVLHAALSAATLVVSDATSAAALGVAIERLQPTLLYAPGAIYAELVHGPGAAVRDLTSLRACLSLGPPLDEGTADRFEQLAGGARLRSLYVPTAAALPTHANPIYGRSSRETIGLPLTDTVATLVDARARRPARAGRPGRLAVYGPQVPGGEDGWLVTGEVATVDDEGRFTLVAGEAQEVTT